MAPVRSEYTYPESPSSDLVPPPRINCLTPAGCTDVRAQVLFTRHIIYQACMYKVLSWKPVTNRVTLTVYLRKHRDLLRRNECGIALSFGGHIPQIAVIWIFSCVVTIMTDETNVLCLLMQTTADQAISPPPQPLHGFTFIPISVF
jgi:hypothetical protein